jgi:hypothetical protein
MVPFFFHSSALHHQREKKGKRERERERGRREK